MKSYFLLIYFCSLSILASTNREFDGESFLEDTRDCCLDMLQFRLEQSLNPNINYTDASGRTALHYAVSEKNKKIVKFLIKNGININQQTTLEKTTALYELAALNIDSWWVDDTIKIAEALVEAGADLQLGKIHSNNDKNFATDLLVLPYQAAEFSNPKLSNYLRKKMGLDSRLLSLAKNLTKDKLESELIKIFPIIHLGYWDWNDFLEELSANKMQDLFSDFSQPEYLKNIENKYKKSLELSLQEIAHTITTNAQTMGQEFQKLLKISGDTTKAQKLVLIPETHDDPRLLLQNAIVIFYLLNKNLSQEKSTRILTESISHEEKDIIRELIERIHAVREIENIRLQYAPSMTYDPEFFAVYSAYIKDSNINLSHDFLAENYSTRGWDRETLGLSRVEGKGLLLRDLSLAKRVQNDMQAFDCLIVIAGAAHFPDFAFLRYSTKNLDSNKLSRNDFFELSKNTYLKQYKNNKLLSSTYELYFLLKESPYTLFMNNDFLLKSANLIGN